MTDARGTGGSSERPTDPVELRTLGPVEATVAGRPVDLGAPKQRALLVLLASRIGQPVPVDVMLEALWPEQQPPSAVASLQAYVANLRKSLEPGRPPRTPPTVLLTRGRGYLLDRRAVELDVHCFEQHAKAGFGASDRDAADLALSEFEAALALWRGGAYAEVPNTLHVAAEAARLEELRLSVLEGRCAALLAIGAHEVAVAELEAFTQAHPLREYGCELLSLALYRAGRQADALGVLRANQRRLGEELGIDPRPALQDLEREILNHASTLDWSSPRSATVQPAPAAVSGPTLAAAAAGAGAAQAPAARTSAPVLPEPRLPAEARLPSEEEIFVGREAALRQLATAAAEAALGRGRTVLVSGEPGIGKTSLLRRFAELNAQTPALWGTCPEHVATPPLWPWLQVLRQVRACRPDHPVPAPVAELLDEDLPRPAGAAHADAATLRRFDAVARYLTGAVAAAPLTIVLDHLHRADPDSLRLLAHLAESVPTSRLLVTAAYHSDQASALAETSAALARAGMTRVKLSGLSEVETGQLAAAMLGQEIGADAAALLRSRAGGNPFYLRELIKQWGCDERPDQLRAPAVPAPLREVVLCRLAALPRPAAELLSVASIAGRHFAIDVVAEAASVEIDGALEAVDAVIAAGLVAEDPARLGWYSFTHAVTAESLVESMGRLRRAQLQRRLGFASVAQPGSLVGVVEVAGYQPPVL